MTIGQRIYRALSLLSARPEALDDLRCLVRAYTGECLKIARSKDTTEKQWAQMEACRGALLDELNALHARLTFTTLAETTQTVPEVPLA